MSDRQEIEFLNLLVKCLHKLGSSDKGNIDRIGEATAALLDAQIKARGQSHHAAWDNNRQS